MKIIFTILLFAFLFHINAQQQISDFSYETTNVEKPSGYIKFDNKILFEASPSESGRELWMNDENSNTSNLLKNIYSGQNSGIVNPLNFSSTTMNGYLYFIAKDENSSGEIWRTDGTTSGTVKITNFLNGGFRKLTTVGDFIYFLRKPSDYILQLWKTDGTAEGTVIVKDNMPAWNRTKFEGNLNNQFIFTFQAEGTNNSKVWRSDGTLEGTFPLTDELDGNGSGVDYYENGLGTGSPSQYCKMNGKLYFATRRHLYVTDGTIANTKIVANVYQANTNLVRFSDVISVNNKLYLMFYTRENQLIIWESDGTSANTKEIFSKTNPNFKYFTPSKFFDANNKLYFFGPNQVGTTSLLSLNLENYQSEILYQVAESIEEPSIFVRELHESDIYSVGANKYFFSVPTSNNNYHLRIGLFFNSSNNNLNEVENLNNILQAYSNNGILYYTKDLQVWKYDFSLLNTNNIQIENTTIYPNPATNYFNKKKKNKVNQVLISNMLGQIILNIPRMKGNKVDISELKPGIFNVKILTDDGIIIKKVIVK